MMKWGRKKPSSSASSISASSSSSSLSHPHSVSHVFPLSWFSRSKQMREKPASGIQKLNQKEKLQISRKITPKSNTKCSSSSSAYKSENSRLYTQDDDGFWRLSFDDHQKVAEDDQNGKISVPPRYCGNCKSNGKQPATRKRTQNSNRKHRDQEHSRGTPSQEEAKDQSLQRTYRRIIEATSELQRELGEVRDGCRKSVEREMQDFELHHAMHHVSARDSEKFHQKAEVEDEDSKETWQKLKEAKIREFLSKGEKQRKSFHLSRDNSQTRVSSSSRHGKLRIQSPRTPAKTETCKIKALENLKKLKMKNTKKKMMMMKMKEITIEDKAAKMESFAVVKSSCDPQKDFRDSMLEMIMEKKIRRPQELEELLACYLTLNSDEYHDLIIKVFRQLWCELEESFFDQKSSEKYYYSNV